MNRHATRFLGALGLVALTVSVPHLAAQEFTWSGTVDGESAVRIADYLDDPDVTGSVTAAVRVRSYIPLGTDGGVELRLRPSYTWSDDRPYLVDVERASADLTLPGVLGAGTVLRGQAGRVPFSAPAPGVLSHTLDAVDLRLSTPLVQARVAGGYSGLLLNPVSDIRMSASDLAEAADDDQFFGPSRAIALGEVSLPEIVLRQTVRVYGIGQWDLRSTDAGEDSLNSFYGGAVVQGPVISGLYHQIAATVSSATSTVEGQSGDTTALGQRRQRRRRRRGRRRRRRRTTASSPSSRRCRSPSRKTMTVPEGCGPTSYGLTPYAFTALVAASVLPCVLHLYVIVCRILLD